MQNSALYYLVWGKWRDDGHPAVGGLRRAPLPPAATACRLAPVAARRRASRTSCRLPSHSPVPLSRAALPYRSRRAGTTNRRSVSFLYSVSRNRYYTGNPSRLLTPNSHIRKLQFYLNLYIIWLSIHYKYRACMIYLLLFRLLFCLQFCPRLHLLIYICMLLIIVIFFK